MYKKNVCLENTPTDRAQELLMMDIHDMDALVPGTEPDFKSGVDQQGQPNRENSSVEIKDFDEVRLNENRAIEKMGNVNWVGRLHEYRVARSSDVSRLEPDFRLISDYTLKTPRFSYSVQIPECTHLLGNTQDPTTFGAKKRAKQFAAKKVIEWLISNNYMPADGSVRFPNPPEASASTHTTQDTITAQVPVLCARLGFMCPRYVIEPISPCASIYNGYADFGSDPRIPDHIGHVYNIYGKKNAKLEIAKQVIAFLKLRIAKVQSQ